MYEAMLRSTRGNRVNRKFITGVLLTLMLAAAGCGIPTTYAQEARCFPETGQCISGRFREYWEQQGGLPAFGYPLTAAFAQDGRTVQYFERQRFELHPENGPPYDVLLGRLGDDALRQHGTDWNTLPKFDPGRGAQADCQYFAQTGHAACGAFRIYWSTHGLEFDGQPGTRFAESLSLFGYPLSEPLEYTASNGETVRAQWFERARFEWHPNNPDPYKVLLGRLGAELLPTMPPPASADVAPAVQTVLDYYTAINARAYAQAYQLWANGGAASGQTFDQFQRGFAQTVQVDVLLGTPQGPDAAGRVTVPVNLAAVVNDPSVPNLGQRVQQFQGTYHVAASAEGWRLASAGISEAVGALPPSALRAPDVLVRSYYEAINRRDIASAYTFWEQLGQASGQTFAQFEQGYANTDQVMVDLGQIQSDVGAGNAYADVPVVIFASQRDGARLTFCGTYTLHSANIPPFNALGWHISRAAIMQIPNVAPGSDQAKRLLNGGCTP
jgi:hypothetical protein